LRPVCFEGVGMGRKHQKIDPRFWRDEKVRELSLEQIDGVMATLGHLVAL